MYIRKMKKSDVVAAVKIVGMNYSKSDEKLARPEILAMFGSGAIRPTYLVAEQKRKVIGFAGYMMSWMDYDIYNIFWVNVHPDYQRQGIGQALIEEVLKNIKKKKVNLVLLSTKTPKFYHRFGFKTLQRFRWGDYLMALKLSKS